eukprot:TRINITY_DN2801_c0_g1::TRINITY_DN2801_c0_g1_i1::g.27370::m.27370 TRINITY_DN2801_c0_g1::TRINITY_DN2801_c0_g1_i1::g.27370  ORF type:complete len:101 (+),score=7.02 TRINITY_DN2801_c0_g1_i1:705-1007(+)
MATNFERLHALSDDGRAPSTMHEPESDQHPDPVPPHLPSTSESKPTLHARVLSDASHVLPDPVIPPWYPRPYPQPQAFLGPDHPGFTFHINLPSPFPPPM